MATLLRGARDLSQTVGWAELGAVGGGASIHAIVAAAASAHESAAATESLSQETPFGTSFL